MVEEFFFYQFEYYEFDTTTMKVEPFDAKRRARIQERLTDLQACRDFYVTQMARKVRKQKDRGYKAVIVIDSNPCYTYNCDAGGVAVPGNY